MGAESKRTPWSASDVCRRHDDGSTEVIRHAIRDARGQEVVTDVETAEARDLIVRTVNTHDEMLEALREAETVLNALDHSGYSQSDVLDTVRTAIANAEAL